MTDSQLQPNTEQVAPCPTCPEGWRPVEKEHCAECYEGQIAALRAKVDELTAALDESVKLQTHYAALLNLYDDGERRTFSSAQEWIDRLAEIASALNSQHRDGEAK